MTYILEKVKELFDWNKKELIIPDHIALTIDGSEVWGNKNNKDLKQAYTESFFNLYKMIREQLKLQIKTLSVFIKPDSEQNNEVFEQALAKFLQELEKDKFIEENKLRISILGKWYEMPHEVVEPIKSIMNKTQEHNQTYLNLCINYNGKQEILDACKLIARKIDAEKLDPETINQETFKQNLYSSDLVPVNLLIKNGQTKTVGSFLLWHSIDAMLYQTNKLWPDFTENDLLKAIVEYNHQLSL